MTITWIVDRNVWPVVWVCEGNIQIGGAVTGLYWRLVAVGDISAYDARYKGGL